MTIELVLAREAEWDIDEAYRWYETQRIGLGEEFLSCIDACFQSLSHQPEANALVQGPFRRALTGRFPYCVYYEFAEDRVTVYVVIHCARDPRTWQERLRPD